MTLNFLLLWMADLLKQTCQTTLAPCQSNERRCDDMTCLARDKFCDFREDCPDASDELMCPRTCSFEDGLCYWTQDAADDFDWSTRVGGQDPSDSFQGPRVDHTLDSFTGHYLYVDGSISPGMNTRARLISPTFALCGRTCKISLWYYIFGVEFGDLEVIIRTAAAAGERKLLKLSDDVSDKNMWIYEDFAVDSCASNFQIIIDAEDKQEIPSVGGFAIDDIRFEDCPPAESKLVCGVTESQCSAGQCYPTTRRCDFQVDCCDLSDEDRSACTAAGYSMCDFESGICDDMWYQVADDDFDWRRRNGATGSAGTGPRTDHTTYTSEGYYIYTEASQPRIINDKAQFASRPLKAAALIDACSLRFFYHMRGDFIGTLNVYTATKINGPMTLIWSREGEKDYWSRKELELQSSSDFMIIFEGVIGLTAEGDIALDDISLTPGCVWSSDPLPVATTPAPGTTVPSHCRRRSDFACYDGMTCVDEDRVCDFRPDCPDGSDEMTCPMACTFEADACYFTETTPDNFDWMRARGADTMATPNAAPREDVTLRTDQGFYMYIAAFGTITESQLAAMSSATYNSADTNCKLSFYYYMAGTLPGELSLYLDNLVTGDTVLLWQKRMSQGEQWQQAVVGIGRRREPFKVRFSKARSDRYQGKIAIDEISFVDCTLPPEESICPPSKLTCDNKACIDASKVCDLADDCGDMSDEMDILCGLNDYKLCDFETDLCGWVQSTTDELEWTWWNGTTLDINSGPSRDHTYGTSLGHFLYLDGQFLHPFKARAQLLSLSFQAAPDGSCQIRFFYHMYGEDVDYLNVYASRYADTTALTDPLWFRFTEQGNFWQRAEITLATSYNFMIVIEATIGDGLNGDIAIDDVSLTSGCVVYNGQLPNTPADDPTTTVPPTTHNRHTGCLEGIFCAPENKCIHGRHLCDFRWDCSDGSDEAGCVQDCDFETGVCGWQEVQPRTFKGQASSDQQGLPSFQWVRGQPFTQEAGESRPDTDHTTGTAQGWYMYVDSSPGTVFDTTELNSPTISQTGGNCQMKFYYHMYGTDVDTFSIFAEANGYRRPLWYRVGGTSQDKWRKEQVYIGASYNFKIIIQARRGASFVGDVTIDDITFIDCEPPLFDGIPCTEDQFTCSNSHCIDAARVCDYGNDCLDYSDELHCAGYPGRCDFSLDICDWFQDDEDDFDWTLRGGNTINPGTGPLHDHTNLNYASGYYIYTEALYPRQAGDRARIHSPTMSRKSTSDCTFRFWYNMRGKDIGTLEVFQVTSYLHPDEVIVIDSLTGEQGDYWQLREVPIPSRGKDFDIVIKGVVGDGSQSEIALDDFSFTASCIGGGVMPDSPFNNSTEQYCADGRLKCATTNQCYDPRSRCDLVADCADGSDEICGNTCDFETDTCGWKNSYKENLDWLRASGDQTENLNTGPTVDHTLGTEFGYYMYVDTSQASGAIGGDNQEKAHLQSLPFQHSGDACTLSLWYHMKGSTIGSLGIFLKTESKVTQLFAVADSQGNKWRSTGDLVIGHQENFAIVIEAVRGITITGDIAIDDVTLENCRDDDFSRPCTDQELTCGNGQCVSLTHVCDYGYDCVDGADEQNCEPQPADCNFDDYPFTTACGWTQLTNDDFDWTQDRSTPTTDTGPNSDHNADGGSFLFIEASGRRQNDMARVATPVFPASTNVCLMRFWYHMRGKSVGTLQVYTKSASSDGHMSLMWTATGAQGSEWNYGSLFVSNNNNFSVVFQGIVDTTGSSDIAIDDVTFLEGCGKPEEAVPIEIPSSCGYQEVLCPADKVCIPTAWLCDGVVDCPSDLYDERRDGFVCPVNSTNPEENFNPSVSSNTGLIVGLTILALAIILGLVSLTVYFVKFRKATKFADPPVTSGLENPTYSGQRDTGLPNETTSGIEYTASGVGFTNVQEETA
ncbi:MAM and LDL-receptor class A domain-containing protein 1-like isoform X2 [Acanthaster planci]|uniref:MAM and LDL-receptor class A domain-containing protein 1-like isoform X2 n=1 Tax=Acanthaster planci TaxID=133434 RepID=A0A8B7YS94_ACAPL|nr:MAM and LDL-receptor class A domain-containing protein 1-like isoform X2 [Acanthaster planci]